MNTIPIGTLISLYHTSLSPAVASGIINSIIHIGAIVGALGSGILLKKLSRRHTLLAVDGFAFLIGWIIYLPYFQVLLSIRFLQGVCLGAFSAIAPLFARQIAPTEISGPLGTICQLNLVFGFFFACFFQYCLRLVSGDQTGESIWMYQFGFTQITIIFQMAFFFTCCKYQSPRYYLLQHLSTQAEQLVNSLYRRQCVQQVLRQKKEDAQIYELKMSGADLELAPRKSRIILIVAVQLAVAQQLCGVNAVAIYGGAIAKNLVTGIRDLVPSLVNFLQLVGTLCSPVLLNRYGRKFLILSGLLGEAISTGIIIAGFFIVLSSNQIGNILIVTGMCLFMLVFGATLGPLIWLYISEVLPPKEIPLSTAANRISAAIIISLFPILVSQYLSENQAPLFIFFASCSLLSFLFNSKYLVETRGKEEKQIAEQYRKMNQD